MKSLRSYFYLTQAWALGMDRDTGLWTVAQYGHTEVVKGLLEAGANVHAKDDEALRLAAFHGHSETVMELLVAGANVHAQNDYALRSARANKHTGTVQVLEQWMAREDRSPEAGGNGAVGPSITPPGP